MTTAAHESSEVRRAGSCKHRPISNGWSGGWSAESGTRPTCSWCGYCRAVVEHDAEWVAKFAAAGKAIPERAFADSA